MKNHSDNIRFFLIGCFCLLAAFSLSLFNPGIYSKINDFASHYVYRLSKRNLELPKIVGIELDSYSLEKLSQRYPLRRTVYAELLKILDEEKVNTVGIDFVFSGDSGSAEDDVVFEDALKSVSSRVVLASLIDPQKKIPNLPLREFIDASYAVGLVNTPEDKDGRIRRLRSFVDLEGKRFYSFSVALSAAFLNKPPEEIVSELTLLKDSTFFINYLLTPSDFSRVSLFDVLSNLSRLKQQYGNDFLKSALVVIYPEATISHDIYSTPLGKIAGGILHINGAASIIKKQHITQMNVVLVPFFIISFVLVYYILRYAGFLQGLLFTLGVSFVDFWCAVFLGSRGIKVDFAYAIIFALLFFFLGSLYKYAIFLSELLKIRIKATIDPMRGIFTLRYFCYRLQLEMKKIYFGRSAFLVFILLEGFKSESDQLNLEAVKELWSEIRSTVGLKGSFWSLYSDEEIVGCVLSSPGKINALLRALYNNLGYLFHEQNLMLKVKIGTLKFSRDYPVRESLFILSGEIKKSKEDVLSLSEADMVRILHSSYPRAKASDSLLDSLGEDIEEKNRQLLYLIDNLNKEAAKTKEAFIEIITSFVKAIEARDPYTQGHSQRVASYALMMGEKLNWSHELKEKLNNAALLHDLGKIGIPDSILHKKGRLTEEEYEMIKKHEVISIKILEPLKEIKEILPWIMYHHEKWDGTGYPHGLRANNIPLGAQIIALADAFDAITTGRDYRTALSTEDAIKELEASKGRQFNPQLTDIFVTAVREMQIQK